MHVTLIKYFKSLAVCCISKIKITYLLLLYHFQCKYKHFENKVIWLKHNNSLIYGRNDAFFLSCKLRSRDFFSFCKIDQLFDVYFKSMASVYLM